MLVRPLRRAGRTLRGFAVVGDEYVTLNIERKLALAMAAGRFVGWMVVGMTIGFVYKPSKTAACPV